MMVIQILREIYDAILLGENIHTLVLHLRLTHASTTAHYHFYLVLRRIVYSSVLGDMLEAKKGLGLIRANKADIVPLFFPASQKDTGQNRNSSVCCLQNCLLSLNILVSC